MYKFNNVQDILISHKYLTIEAPKSTGMMLDLKGFDEADIKMLKAAFSPQTFRDRFMI